MSKDTFTMTGAALRTGANSRPRTAEGRAFREACRAEIDRRAAKRAGVRITPAQVTRVQVQAREVADAAMRAFSAQVDAGRVAWEGDLLVAV